MFSFIDAVPLVATGVHTIYSVGIYPRAELKKGGKCLHSTSVCPVAAINKALPVQKHVYDLDTQDKG